MQKDVITIHHSPDSDDAFMFYGLLRGAISHPEFTFSLDSHDIESLNTKTIAGKIDCTAVSVHAYALLKNQYTILTCGASMGGEQYGPRLVTREPFAVDDGKKRTFATPGEHTSAALALQLFLKENDIKANVVHRHFEKVEESVQRGEVDGGVVIHEAQITHERSGLTTVLDLGQWWWQRTGKPMPLGVTVVRKSLGAEAIYATAQVVYDSIDYGLSNREEALEHALKYGRGLTAEEIDIYVGMYVNERTLDIGYDGTESIEEFLGLGVKYGLVPGDIELEFAAPFREGEEQRVSIV